MSQAPRLSVLNDNILTKLGSRCPACGKEILAIRVFGRDQCHLIHRIICSAGWENCPGCTMRISDYRNGMQALSHSAA